MRTSFTLFLAATLALSANAASVLEKRATTGYSQSCIQSMLAVKNQSDLTKKDLDTWVPTPDVTNASQIDLDEHVLEDLLKQATANCCVSDLTGVALEDFTNAENTISTSVTSFTAALESMKKSKPVFDTIPNVTAEFKVHIFYLSDAFDALFSCLATSSRPEFLPTVQKDKTTIADAFASAKLVYST